MALRPGSSGYQPETRSASSRRADFDLLRRIRVLEKRGDGGGSGQRPYVWRNETTAVDPTSGRAKANALPASATELYISFYDSTGTAFLLLSQLQVDDGISLYIEGSLSNNVRYKVAAATTSHPGDWLTIPVTLFEDNSFVPSQNQPISVFADTGGGGGGGGGGAMSYVHNQGTAAATWIVTHNLGWYPNVTVEDSTGTTCEGDIVYNDTNQLTLIFSAAFSGIAYLS